MWGRESERETFLIFIFCFTHFSANAPWWKTKENNKYQYNILILCVYADTNNFAESSREERKSEKIERNRQQAARENLEFSLLLLDFPLFLNLA